MAVAPAADGPAGNRLPTVFKKGLVVSHAVLVLTPHPDDAEFYAGGILAQLAGAGSRIIIAIATDGRRGSFTYASDELAAVRAAEARAAAAILGADVILLNHPDFELDRLPTGQLREEFLRLIREVRPEVLVAQDPYTVGEHHPDHRATAWAAAEAVTFAALPLLHPEHRAAGLEPHFVAEKYFYLPDATGANKIIDISDMLPRKIAALLAHTSQVDFLVEDVFRQARLAGLAITDMPGAAAGDKSGALAWATEVVAAQIGQAGGVPFGEAFRYVRFDPLVEGLLQERH